MAAEETRTEEAKTAETAAERRPPRRTAAQMAIVGVVASILGIIAGLLIHWFPPASSTQADKIDTLWDVLIVASVPFFVLVTTVIGFSILNFRMRPGEENLDGPPIHGNTRLEVIWTAIPATIIVGLVVYAYVVLRDIEKTPALAAGQKERVVRVFGEQFAWTFEYNENGRKFRTTELDLPAGQSVKFLIQSKDVIHDFWVPDFRMKIDAVPGITTSYRVTPKQDSIGVHQIVCAELCGLGHAFMRSTVRVRTGPGFTAWVRRTSAAANGSTPVGGGGHGGGQAGGGQNASAAAKAIFTNGKNATGATACGACHTLAEASTNGTTGPNLDQVLKGKDAAFIKQSIEQPDAEIAKGYTKGIMPPNYRSTLKPAELAALVKFLSDATK
jgi:cytochrome c oxidase subunit II